MVEDSELLRRYVDDESEESFAELLNRHLGLVYFGALRRLSGDAHLAADVSQQVFVSLARHARSLQRHPALTAWLFTTTRNFAINAQVAEERRRRREQEAHAMQETPPVKTPSVDWEGLRPMLHEALDGLLETDRRAVLLRFFAGQAFSEIGRALRVTEDAARKRVERALGKLHGRLTQRGITSTISAMSAALSAEAALVPPAALSATITAAVASGTGATGAGVLAFFTMNKITAGVAVIVAVALTTSGLIEVRANRELRTELGMLRSAESDVTRLQKESRELTVSLQKLGATNPDAAELARLQQRVVVLRARPPGVLDSELRPASTWRNVGRATPEAAFETLRWAMFTGDWALVASFINFDDDTPANRENFMTQFSPVIRQRYGTPEGILAAAFFGAGSKNTYSPDDAVQVIALDDHVGGDGSRFGQKRLRAWFQFASGKEFEGFDRWALTSDGWTLAPFSLEKDSKNVVRLLDPDTGKRVPQANGPGAK